MQQTFIEGTTNGRNGKGTIFMWAGGNGGGARDNVNYDGVRASSIDISVKGGMCDLTDDWSLCFFTVRQQHLLDRHRLCQW
jgi:hypothetical protein